ncbi:MAG TPA: peptidylprolyl isomerase [Gammaproteobacteria bacterium]|nr:peptidylprolyl isomerase [Gammaproteobacteria bacterium]
MMMMFRRPILIASLIVAAGGCSQGEAPANADSALGPGRVATVNGDPIPESLFRYYAMNATQKNPDELTAEERTAVIEELIGFKLLTTAAEERGLLTERTMAAELELQRLQVIARAMALRHLSENPATEAELQKVYDENLPRLAGTQYKARHILVESKDEAVAVIEQLRQGTDFVALAQEHSSGPTGPNGGDLGWFTAASMVQPVADAVRAMEVGTYSSEPVETNFGFHVLLLEDTRTQEPPTLDAVRAELTNAVDRSKLEEFVRSLREGATVTVEE